MTLAYERKGMRRCAWHEHMWAGRRDDTGWKLVPHQVPHYLS